MFVPSDAIVTTQRPFVHWLEHWSPQPPQLPLSVCRSTHLLPQPTSPFWQQTPFDTVLPLGHTQAPWTQVGAAGSLQGWRVAHVVPQAVSCQRFVSHPSLPALQSPKPLLHEVMPHTPFTHVGPLPFAAEQLTVEQLAPQLVGELITFSQPFAAVPSQSIVPLGQATHAP